jgi:prepilin-type N-terminal cleavage/methylation domain-containing protein
MLRNTQKDQKGFTLVEVLLVVIALTLIVGVGAYVYKSNKDSGDSGTPAVHKSAAANSEKPADPTADWTAYTSKSGKFSLRYPKSWVTASNPDLCADGIFMLGATGESVGKCASENFGQMAITWRTDRAACGDLDSDAWTTDAKVATKVAGVDATKITATAKAPGFGLGTVPEGTRTVQYCFVANNTTYIADYTQLSSYPDALSDFNTMVTKTFTTLQ